MFVTEQAYGALEAAGAGAYNAITPAGSEKTGRIRKDQAGSERNRQNQEGSSRIRKKQAESGKLK